MRTGALWRASIIRQQASRPFPPGPADLQSRRPKPCSQTCLDIPGSQKDNPGNWLDSGKSKVHTLWCPLKESCSRASS